MKNTHFLVTAILFVMSSLVSTGYSQSGPEGLAVLKQANEMAERARSKKDMEKALAKFQDALTIFEKSALAREQGATLNNIAVVHNMWGQYGKALEYYKMALNKREEAGDLMGSGISLNNIGLVYDSIGEPDKALEYYDKSLCIAKKIGDERQEAATLNNIASIYELRGQYTKALEYFEMSLTLMQQVGDLKGEAFTINDIGKVYSSRGEHAKAMEYYDKALAIMREFGDSNGEANTLTNMGRLYAQIGRYPDAEETIKRSIDIFDRLGLPTEENRNILACLYLDMGALSKAEALLKSISSDSSLGRLAFMKSAYTDAIKSYEKGVTVSKRKANVDELFACYTGLASANEALENYDKAEIFYEKAMNLLEDIRSGLMPSERRNFFGVTIGGFSRKEPAKGLARIRMKLNRQETGVQAIEVTKARAFADHLIEASAVGASGVQTETLEKGRSIENRVVALKKELAKTDRIEQPGKYEILSNDIQEAEADLNQFIDILWKHDPAYAAVKYPRPVGIRESALEQEECVVMFDVSNSGVVIKLIRGKKEAENFFKKWDSEALVKDVIKFRASFENKNLREFDPELGNSLYRKLLQAVLVDVPRGTPLIIIPDGALAMLPFEALVTDGKATWKKLDNEWPEQFKYFPDGITFLGDEHPISYYPSLSTLTLVRNLRNKDIPSDSLLVIADPVFSLKDERAQLASSNTLSKNEKEDNFRTLQAIEETSGLKFGRLPKTGTLAQKLQNMYGEKCLALTGLKANKSDFLVKVAPRLNQYGKVVFATHGVVSENIAGLMEPFLALSMVPYGADGFLKMSDILRLKMNADVVALTACQTGLGREVSGEGILSMGRAFQFAGARSVLMTLWEVEELSAITMSETFFKFRKSGKSKLESLQAARDDIRKAGYKHPFFWSAFILVGEAI